MCERVERYVLVTAAVLCLAVGYCMRSGYFPSILPTDDSHTAPPMPASWSSADTVDSADTGILSAVARGGDFFDTEGRHDAPHQFYCAPHEVEMSKRSLQEFSFRTLQSAAYRAYINKSWIMDLTTFKVCVCIIVL